MLKEAVLEAIEEFNKFRSPEAKAELLYIRGNVIVVKMSGTYCRSCGVYDYFERTSCGNSRIA